MVRLANAALGLLLAASSVAAELIYFDDPVDLWTTTLSGTELEYMNAVTMSPDDQLLYVTGNDGSMKALDPEDGSPVFSYKSPEINGYTLMGSSGVSFLIDVEEPSSYTIACAANLYNTLNPAEKKR
jgi:WD40 repeat protein